jgi:hypothetical protein
MEEGRGACSAAASKSTKDGESDMGTDVIRCLLYLLIIVVVIVD